MPYRERGGWRGTVLIRGVRSRRWFPSKVEAKEWEASERKRLKALKPRTPTGLLTLCVAYLDYMERYSKSTYSHKKTLCKRLLAAWGDIEDVTTITPLMCSQYLDQRATVSGNAANEDLFDLKSLFKYFDTFHDIKHNPLLKIAPYSHQKKIPYVPPREDLLKLTLVTTAQDRVMLDVFRYTPARRSEIMKLAWEDILFEQRTIRLTTHKSRKGEGKRYYVPMNNALYESLQSHWKTRDKTSPYVFTHDGKPYTRREDWLPKLCDMAGIKPFGYHSFRRAFATGIMATGKASVKDVSLLLGHSTVRHTEEYLFSINPNLFGLVEMIEKDTKCPKDLPNEA